ncbi:MAG: hypothetical protein HFF11_08545 [Angelakisella sp.]|jgi:hypothetical protein|nr:hypothetical protein [Angelakisella sp.]
MRKTARTAEGPPPVTLVLVTDQFHCQRLITAGRQLADQTGTALEVVNVADPGRARNPQAIEFLFQTSRDHDAAMTIHYSAKPEHFLGELILERSPAAVVTGLPGEGSSLLRKLWLRFDKTAFYLVDQEGALRPVSVLDRAEAGRDIGQGILPYVGLTPVRLGE